MVLRTHASTKPRTDATLMTDLIILPHRSPNAECTDSSGPTDATAASQDYMDMERPKSQEAEFSAAGGSKHGVSEAERDVKIVALPE